MTTQSSRRPGAFKKILTDYGIVIALVVIIAFFSALRPDTFPTIGNFGSILQANASIMFIAFGLMLPLIVGHFDLSVAAMAGFGGVLATGLMSHGTITFWPLAVLVVGVVAVIVGLFNGLLVAYLKLNALVVTLGTQSILFGAILWYSKGAVIYSDIPQSFKDLGQSRPLGIPLPFIFAVIVGFVLWYVLYYRPIGRRLYATGGSPDAARLTGIKVDKLTVAAFTCGAVLAAIGGCLQVAQVGSAAPTSGNEFLLPAIAACFLGETSIRRGYYNVWGTLTAVILVATGTTGLFMLGAETYVQPVFNGLVLIGAILAARIDTVKALIARLQPTPPAETRPLATAGAK
jgi:ribose transport system permease protein